MPSFTKIRNLLRRDKAAVSVIVAMLMVVVVGFLGMAVDLGALYAARGELQNTADAAALAGAQTLITADGAGNAIAQPDTAVTTAQTISAANEAGGVTVGLRLDDITMGFWDSQIGDFDPSRTGPSGNPDDLTAFKVVTRRDDLANTPVATYFSGILGLPEVSATATSIAYLGYAGSVQEGTVDLPIAVDEAALTDGGDNPLCGTAIEFHSNNVQNGFWTSFFSWPTNDNVMRSYADGSIPTPPLSVGDDIAITNGNLSVNTFNAISERYEANQTGGEWKVILPVVSNGGSYSSASVVGFVTMVITAVENAPVKNIVGRLECGMVIPNSQTGGDNFGSRATAAKLIQ